MQETGFGSALEGARGFGHSLTESQVWCCGATAAPNDDAVCFVIRKKGVGSRPRGLLVVRPEGRRPTLNSTPENTRRMETGKKKAAIW
jgi:hypothetical protein